ncbi:hypothetical protein EON82_10470 [bacterium]|nr:MAG: hypothetical protein EON82_10470 [bacterium]
MKALVAALFLVPCLAFAQAAAETPIRVSLDARGEDVREVLATLFAQAKKPYALDASIKGKLYVKLDAMPYEKALAVVLAQTGLKVKDREGVVMISPAKVSVAVAPKPVAVKTAASLPIVSAKPLNEKAILARKVTTKLIKAPLADVFASFGKQAKIEIEIDSSVPAYRIDAFFTKSSLRYSLDQVCKAAGLRYEFVDNKIQIVSGSLGH